MEEFPTGSAWSQKRMPTWSESGHDAWRAPSLRVSGFSSGGFVAWEKEGQSCRCGPLPVWQWESLGWDPRFPKTWNKYSWWCLLLPDRRIDGFWKAYIWLANFLLRKCLNLHCSSVCSGRIPLTSTFFFCDTALAEFPMLLPKGNIHSSPERTSETGRWLLFKCLIHPQWYWLMHEPNICATLDWFSLSCIELILIQNDFSLVIAIIWFRPAGFFVQIRVESDKTPTFAKPSTFAADWADPCMYSNTSSSSSSSSSMIYDSKSNFYPRSWWLKQLGGWWFLDVSPKRICPSIVLCFF